MNLYTLRLSWSGSENVRLVGQHGYDAIDAVRNWKRSYYFTPDQSGANPLQPRIDVPSVRVVKEYLTK